MANVYSVRFIAEVGLSGSSSFLVPGGFRAVVRDADVYAHDLAGGDLYFEGSSGQTIWHLSIPGAGVSVVGQWRGRQVFMPGETFDFRTTAAADVTVSGYLLALP